MAGNPQDAFAIAEQRIQAALKSGVHELHLNGLELTELPSSIGQLFQLQQLDIL